MTLSDWLQRISINHPSKIELGLDRISRVVSELHLHKFNCPVITVAGTNGKGSTIGFLEQLYVRAGLRVGSFTSPHLLTFNERIKLQAQSVDDARICDAFAAIDAQRGATTLTYFEYVTAAALIIFQHAKLDVVLLEVGLGGRLDATNCVDPTVAVVTSIDLDHQAWLGDDREAIGREKAGIFRSKGLTVCGDPKPPQSLLDQAERLQTQLSRLGHDYTYQTTDTGWTWRNSITELSLPAAQLPIQNIATALQVVSLLQTQLAVDNDLIPKVVAEAKVEGRLQRLPGNKARWVDVAHNPQSARYLAQWLQQQGVTGRIIAVWSMLQDKDLPGSLAPLTQLVDDWFIGPLDVERAADAAQLSAAAEEVGLTQHRLANSLEQAYQQAVQAQQPGDLLIVFGSFHTVAKVLEIAL